MDFIEYIEKTYVFIKNNPHMLWPTLVAMALSSAVTAAIFKIFINNRSKDPEQKADNNQKKLNYLKCLLCGSTNIFLSKRHEDGKGNKVFYVTYPYEFTCNVCGEISGFTRDELMKYEFIGQPKPKENGGDYDQTLKSIKETMRKGQEAIDRSNSFLP